MSRGWIGISLGDVTGIGPEVALKALAALGPGRDDTRYLILGDPEVCARLRDRLELPLSWQRFTDYAAPGHLYLFNPHGDPLPATIRQGSEVAARAAIACLRDGALRCLRGELDALVTAPLNKAAVIRTGMPFVGQTEFLSELAGAARAAMMLLGADDAGRWLRVVLATTHVPLRQVADQLRQDKIEAVIELAVEACGQLGLGRARVGVCGVNPHAGEEGKLGVEDGKLVAPAVAAARRRGLEVSGPWPADTLFHQAWRGDFEVVVAMYHDQGLAPLKMVAFDRGVNWTLGLPFTRTSPDHGTAYDLAGKGVANPSSMIAAIELARQLARRKRQGIRPAGRVEAP
jgi:4-hydroxythreonine-4-phosphate dehydrogenase